MTRMRQSGNGRMLDEKRMLCRMSAALDGYFDGIASDSKVGRITLITHGQTSSLRVEYGPFSMETDGIEIRKHTAAGWRPPTKSEIRRFKADAAEAAKTDAGIADFLRCNPGIMG
ncbi:MAG: hypothetical protein AB1295_00155 [Candidatus Micrarchaeota archaeon]